MQHYAAASTVYNFGQVAGLGRSAGFGDFGQVESRDAWGGRIGSAQHAINRAKSTGVPGALMMMSSAEGPVAAARAVVYAARDAGEWTPTQEEQVAKRLQEARQAFDMVQSMNIAMGGGQFPVPFPTWTMSAVKLPTGSPGTLSPGTLPTKAPAGAAPGEGPVPPPPPRARFDIYKVAMLGGMGLVLFLVMRRR
jgi:hypothetical protein